MSSAASSHTPPAPRMVEDDQHDRAAQILAEMGSGGADITAELRASTAGWTVLWDFGFLQAGETFSTSWGDVLNLSWGDVLTKLSHCFNGGS